MYLISAFVIRVPNTRAYGGWHVHGGDLIYLYFIKEVTFLISNNLFFLKNNIIQNILSVREKIVINFFLHTKHSYEFNTTIQTKGPLASTSAH